MHTEYHDLGVLALFVYLETGISGTEIKQKIQAKEKKKQSN